MRHVTDSKNSDTISKYTSWEKTSAELGGGIGSGVSVLSVNDNHDRVETLERCGMTSTEMGTSRQSTIRSLFRLHR